MERTPQLQVVEKMQDIEQFMLPFILKKRKKRRGEENKNIFCFYPQNPTSSYLPTSKKQQIHVIQHDTILQQQNVRNNLNATV